MKARQYITRLPHGMQHYDNSDDWTDHFRSALLMCLQSGDEAVLSDFLDMAPTASDADHRAPHEDQLHDLTAIYTPAAAYDAWSASEQWIAAIRCLNLADVVGDATSWSPDLRLEVSYWLVEHATAADVEQLSQITGPTDLCRYFQNHDLDIEHTLTQLTDCVSPTELAHGWNSLHPEPLTNRMLADWRELQQTHNQLNRWHTPAGRELLRRLNALRVRGISCRQLGEHLNLSTQTVYTLTITPPQRRHSKVPA